MQNKVSNTTQCYIRKNGKTLLLHRKEKDKDTLGGKWIAVGGNFDPGETPEECVKREVEEESGLVLKKITFRGLITFAVKKTDGNMDTCYAFIFESESFEGEIIDCDEGDLQWVPDEEILRKNILDKDRIFIPWIYEGRKLFSAKFKLDEQKLISHEVEFYAEIK